MQTSLRSGPYRGGQRSKHESHISISDDNHHVTDAISSLYGYGEPPLQHESRPLSFLPSAREEIHTAPLCSSPGRAPPARVHAYESNSLSPNGPSTGLGGGQSSSYRDHGEYSSSSSPSLPSLGDTAASPFPLNDIDYESSAAAVAQELNNLQALRRMSMDVNIAGDPDLPTFSSFGMPAVAPTGAEDEDDTSRLFWVPASLHPELAPQEFKTFLDTRVDSMKKRRSGDFSLTSDGHGSMGSQSGLRRQKSMLSRQIDNTGGRGAEGYRDGAERLDRQKSQGSRLSVSTESPNLQDLETPVNDPSQILQRLSLESARSGSGGEILADQDMPILPAAPMGNSLRRSTRTAYRRSSLRKGERLQGPKRAARVAEVEADEMARGSSPTLTSPTLTSSDDTRSRTDPLAGGDTAAENFSRPGRLHSYRQRAPPSTESAPVGTNGLEHASVSPVHSQRVGESSLHSEPRQPLQQAASAERINMQPGRGVPQIIQTPPAAEESKVASPQSARSEWPSHYDSQSPPVHPPSGAPSTKDAKRLAPSRQTQPDPGNPSPLPGNSARTDKLSPMSTSSEDKKSDAKKSISKKGSNDGSKKSSWSWGSLLGNDEKEKEKEKKKEMEGVESGKKGKTKHGKPADSARLDLLQTAMDGSKGRESLVLDRGDIKLEEERKKESSRKSSEVKREKEHGLLSSLFGGGKKKSDRDSYGKKSARTLSPEPPRPALVADVDYNWTRFSILEERAIYRMAHLKLANPKRALHSQVLLSNFMYSYLAKVQQMHPQVQVPQTAAQKAQQRQTSSQQQQQRKAEQPEEYYQYQKYQEMQQQQDQQAQMQSQSSHHESATYVDDAQNYKHDHDVSGERHQQQPGAAQRTRHREDGQNHHGQRSVHGYESPSTQHSTSQYQQSQFDEPERAQGDDMW